MSKEHHWCLWKSFHFPPFFPFLFFSPFLYGPWRWTCPIFIHAAFYSEKQKERKMRWYREIGRGFFFLCLLTLPHYRSLCWRMDRNGALWAKEWPIHPIYNIPLLKGYCCIFHLFVEMFAIMAASQLCLMTLREEIRHMLFSFAWYLLFLSSIVGLQKRAHTVLETTNIKNFF